LARLFRVAYKLSDRRKPAVFLGYSDCSEWSDLQDSRTANLKACWRIGASTIL